MKCYQIDHMAEENMKEKNKPGIAIYIILHIMLMLYSMGGILSKSAAGESFLSLRFCLLYGGLLVILGLYAIGWQQMIKRMPLTTAFANKAVTVVWGLVWGLLFFGESITTGKVIGALMVVGGIVLFALSDEDTSSVGQEDPK